MGPGQERAVFRVVRFRGEQHRDGAQGPEGRCDQGGVDAAGHEDQHGIPGLYARGMETGCGVPRPPEYLPPGQGQGIV